MEKVDKEESTSLKTPSRSVWQLLNAAKLGHTGIAQLNAAKLGHTGIAQELLKHNAEVNGQGLDGMTSLHVAALNKHSDMVIMLLEAGADGSLKSESGQTPYDAAKLGGDETCMRLLLNAELIRCCREGSKSEVQKLLSAKADPNYLTKTAIECQGEPQLLKQDSYHAFAFINPYHVRP
eukprot:g12733.t1